MNDSKFFAFVCVYVFFLIGIEAVLSQDIEKEQTAKDNVLTGHDAKWYYTWLPDRIKTDSTQVGNHPPTANLCEGVFEFSGYGHIENGEKRYCMFLRTRSGSRIVFQEFIRQLDRYTYCAYYEAVQENTIFPVMGSLYCLDDPMLYSMYDGIPKKFSSAFRIQEKDYPNGVTLRKKSIVIPMCPDLKYQYSATTPENGYYDKTKILIQNYETNPQQKNWGRAYIRTHEYAPDVKARWYKAGDLLPFSTISHTIINIVLPDTEDCRVVHRKNKDGTTTELKGSLIGWVELDPTPLPFDAKQEKKTLIPEEQLRKEQEGTEKNEPVTRLHPVKTSAEK